MGETLSNQRPSPSMNQLVQELHAAAPKRHLYARVRLEGRGAQHRIDGSNAVLQNDDSSCLKWSENRRSMAPRLDDEFESPRSLHQVLQLLVGFKLTDRCPFRPRCTSHPSPCEQSQNDSRSSNPPPRPPANSPAIQFIADHRPHVRRCFELRKFSQRPTRLPELVEPNPAVVTSSHVLFGFGNGVTVPKRQQLVHRRMHRPYSLPHRTTSSARGGPWIAVISKSSR